MLIITCSGRRTPKVALKIIDKGVCSRKGMYFYGLKLHALGFRCKDKLPFPEQLLIAHVSYNDFSFLNLHGLISSIDALLVKIYSNQ